MIRRCGPDERVEIQAIWSAVEEDNPDISTERLFAMVQDVFNGNRPTKMHIDAGDIADAMKEVADKENARE